MLNNKNHQIKKYLKSDCVSLELLKLIFCEDNNNLTFRDIKHILNQIEFKFTYNEINEDIMKNIAWCKSRSVGIFNKRLREYRKDVYGKIIKYNEYNTKGLYGWSLENVIPENNIINYIFNIQAISIDLKNKFGGEILIKHVLGDDYYIEDRMILFTPKNKIITARRFLDILETLETYGIIHCSSSDSTSITPP